MPQCVILVGPPGVGKSTWIETNNDSNAIILSTDAELEAIAEQLGKTYNDVFKSHFKAAEKAMWVKADIAYQEGRDVIVDRTNMTAASRRKFIDYFKDPGDFYFSAVVFDLPDPIEWKRRLNSRPGKTIPDFVIDNMMKSFEFPRFEEGFNYIEICLNGEIID